MLNGKAKQHLTLLTTAHPDIEVMGAFSRALAVFVEKQYQIYWCVVNTQRLYRNCPDQIKNEAYELNWLSPSRSLSQLEGVLFGLEQLSRINGLYACQPLLIMDPDMVNNILDIPEFLECCKQGSEGVFAWRQEREGVSRLRQFMTQAFNKLAGSMLRIEIHDINSPMFLLSSSVQDQLLREGRFDAAIRYRLIYQLRHKLAEVPIQVKNTSGSSYRFSGLMKVGMQSLYELLCFWLDRRQSIKRDKQP